MASDGSILAGRYRLGEVIGRGGMSTVYRAEDLRLERTVAVKVMSAALAERDPVSIARFEREARAAASLTHPGIATVYDTGVEGAARYIVMELAPGRSLQAIIQEEAPLPPARAVDIAAQVADVLSVAHAAGIVHRDVKPGNVMVAPDGSVKVLDFGIARAAGGATLTQVHSVVGTVAFMSPEQAMGAPTDARSDIYALGCVVYAMLAAKPPFMAEVTAAVLHQHTSVRAPAAARGGVCRAAGPRGARDADARQGPGGPPADRRRGPRPAPGNAGSHRRDSRGRPTRRARAHDDRPDTAIFATATGRRAAPHAAGATGRRAASGQALTRPGSVACDRRRGPAGSGDRRRRGGRRRLRRGLQEHQHPAHHVSRAHDRADEHASTDQLFNDNAERVDDHDHHHIHDDDDHSNLDNHSNLDDDHDAVDDSEHHRAGWNSAGAGRDASGPGEEAGVARARRVTRQ